MHRCSWRWTAATTGPKALDVALAEGPGAETTVRLNAAGTDKIVYGPGTVAAEAISRGLPVIVVAVSRPKLPISLISFSDVALKTPKGLEGKKRGVSVGETFSNMRVPFARLNRVGVHADLLAAKAQSTIPANGEDFLTAPPHVITVCDH